jgi:spore coat polysaccharide biosynthesis protein SpsF (cytidylyltransferase family)
MLIEMNMRIGIIIQARTGSTRLPNKMILPFYNNKGILENILIRLKEASLNIPIILATTVNPIDDHIEEIGLKYGVEIFKGSEGNVLDRFIKAAEKNNISKIIRVCADNPFLDMVALRKQVDAFKYSNKDYWCYSKSDLTPTIKTHFGFWTEGVKLAALKKVAKLTNEELFQEHVTNYIYNNPETFELHFETINKSIENETHIRLTIDTADDFEMGKQVYSDLFNNKIPFEVKHIVNFVNSNSAWIAIMKKEIITNTKTK